MDITDVGCVSLNGILVACDIRMNMYMIVFILIGCHVDLETRLEVLMAAELHVEFLWAVTPSNILVRYQRFVGPYCLYLQGHHS